MIKMRLNGLPENIEKSIEIMKKDFDVSNISNPTKNRSSSFVRVYADLEIKEENNND